jgi:hypothetical protein
MYKKTKSPWKGSPVKYILALHSGANISDLEMGIFSFTCANCQKNCNEMSKHMAVRAQSLKYSMCLSLYPFQENALTKKGIFKGTQD